MKNPVVFNYGLDKVGEANGTIRIGTKEFIFKVSNVSNPLNDLLKGMSSLILEPSHLWGDENVQIVDWYCDSCGFKWFLTTNDGELLKVKLIHFADIFDEQNGAIVFESKCNINDFFLAIISELDQFIKVKGLLNYEQQWQKDEFPITHFLFLKKTLIERNYWNEKELNTSILEEEIGILLA